MHQSLFCSQISNSLPVAKIRKLIDAIRVGAELQQADEVHADLRGEFHGMCDFRACIEVEKILARLFFLECQCCIGDD